MILCEKLIIPAEDRITVKYHRSALFICIGVYTCNLISVVNLHLTVVRHEKERHGEWESDIQNFSMTPIKARFIYAYLKWNIFVHYCTVYVNGNWARQSLTGESMIIFIFG